MMHGTMNIKFVYCVMKNNCYSLVMYSAFGKSLCISAMVYRDHQRTLSELKTAIVAYVRNISQADLQKVFVNKIKWVQTCIDSRVKLQMHLQIITPFSFVCTYLQISDGTSVLGYVLLSSDIFKCMSTKILHKNNCKVFEGKMY